jgi:hypothetical protein
MSYLVFEMMDDTHKKAALLRSHFMRAWPFIEEQPAK